MATITISLGGICSGGNHVTVNASVDGGGSAAFNYLVDDLRENISADDMKDALSTILRFRFKGKTLNQAKQDLQAGFSITI